MHPIAKLDHRHVWHPFTQMRDWLKREPIILVEGKGAVLRDARGREYLDANSSIWTNLHGHQHPRINAAIRRQLDHIAHSSALGFANEPASRLAARLVRAANPPLSPSAPPPSPSLQKVFFSDDGSTALEVALKLAYEVARRTTPSNPPRFLSLDGAYHGDTVGAVALGHINLFHKAYSGLLFHTDKVMAPYCYRCPFNRAQPERADARDYRVCRWECIGQVERRFAARDPFSAGGHEVNFADRRVFVDGGEVRLTPREFELLQILARHAGRPVTHMQINAAVRGPAAAADPQFVRVLVGQLRQKLETDPSSPRFVLTDPGFGYRLIAED